MKVLIIGSGAREHAIAKAFARSAVRPDIYCLSNQVNPGIKRLCSDYCVSKPNCPQTVVQYAQQKQVNMVIIGPEAPLAHGVADALWEKQIPVVGPTKQLAQLETSKAFTRDLMAKHAVPGAPKYQVFNSMDGVQDFLNELGDAYVIKADGLMGGKGVKVAGDHLASHEQALAYCEELIAANSSFVIEEKFIGQEFSLLSFSDGKHLVHMPIVQDHKRAFAGDKGPNTGGMGSYSCADHRLPFLSESDVREAQVINEKAVHALHDEFQERYIGIIYGGFIATAKGAKLIEFNARFGDPEAINILPLLETDFVKVCEAMTTGNLAALPVSFKCQATVCKYAVPEGYPEQPVKNQSVNISQVEQPDALYLAAVDERDGELIETGSRTIAVLCVGDSLSVAEQQAEELIRQIQGPLVHRADIGTSELINQRIKHMNTLRDDAFELL